jgi:hypothetical protein
VLACTGTGIVENRKERKGKYCMARLHFEQFNKDEETKQKKRYSRQRVQMNKLFVS